MFARTYACELRWHSKDSENDGFERLGQEQRHASDLGLLPGIHQSVEGLLAKLGGICIRKSIDYWKYELCFDSKVTQSHGRDSFLLGTYAGMEGSRQLYSDGTLCDAGGSAFGKSTDGRQGGKFGRESRVEFVCDTALRIVSVEEVATCSYKVYVTTPLVCGHPEFLQSTRTIPQFSKGGSREFSGPPKHEWYLEAAVSSTGQVTCSAVALRPDSSLRLQNFELSLYYSPSGNTRYDHESDDDDLAAGLGLQVELKPELDVVRSQGRRTLSRSSKDYTLSRSDENSRVSLKSARAFGGQMTFASLTVVPVLDE